MSEAEPRTHMGRVWTKVVDCVIRKAYAIGQRPRRTTGRPALVRARFVVKRANLDRRHHDQPRPTHTDTPGGCLRALGSAGNDGSPPLSSTSAPTPGFAGYSPDSAGESVIEASSARRRAVSTVTSGPQSS